MVSTAISMPSARVDRDLASVRLYVLRATYLLIAAGEGSQVFPALFVHEPAARGVIPALLSGLCLLCLFGLKYPRQMLPLLMFEFAWKLIWLLAFGLPERLAGQTPSTFTDDFAAIGFGVVLMPLVLPWPYIWRSFVKAPGEPWQGPKPG